MYVFLGGAPCKGFCLLCDPCHVCMYMTIVDNNNNNNRNSVHTTEATPEPSVSAANHMNTFLGQLL